MTSGYTAGFSFQLRLFLSRPSEGGVLVAVPFTTAVFLSVVAVAGRDDLVGAALLAPALYGLWSVTLALGGMSLAGDKSVEMLELLLAAPASFAGYLWGRLTMSALVGLLAYSEAWAVGVGVFQARPIVHHPWWFAAALFVTAVGTISAGALVAAVVGLSRNSRSLPNFMNYPLFVLAGFFTPVALLPDWLKPLSGCIYLSWGADLARASLRAGPQPEMPRMLLAELALTIVMFPLSALLLARIVRTLRTTGRLTT
ncbi:ABC transporter permease [Amycolatopsis sp. SID8362]|uniref:ABC transporter permease n=1 Tax=Amycolatopsis sp. SID8362 TaxID=2690346 RepID=UPI00136A1D52|nr:ABC transporter permease [Amycolatopsis sp. SID8362]NBH08571.1 ABC transporter permease [Amycolatopsis sp. SID8362]NED45265.1 ABC transporter permease [Amycolatopsis sp. SID8362]